MRMAGPSPREAISPRLEISTELGDGTDVKPRWKSLFAFTTKCHLTVMIPAGILSVVAGGIRPSLSIFMGFIFDDMAKHVPGAGDYSLLLGKVSTWCVA